MRIGIYNEPSGGTLGGCESAVAWVANTAMSLGHTVEVVHHQPWLRREDLEAFAGVSLAGVAFRPVPSRPQLCGSSWLLWRRFAEARAEGREVSAGYDLFFCFAHGVPPFNHSPRGILSILFPLVDVMGFSTDARSWRERARGLYTDWEWRRRVATYGTQTAISEFTAKWSRTRWGVAPSILYPPVDITFPRIAKTRSIVSIGRFTRGGHPKRQDALVDAFRMLSARASGVTLTCLGSLSANADDSRYFSQLSESAAGCPIVLNANASRAEIVGSLAAASIYWHAAGFGEPADSHPERMEHFGISTVEAMAAGCVPVVINRGGQPDIVEHGVSGFVWETLDELTGYTIRLLEDEALRERMSAAARLRAETFSIESFGRQVAAMLRGTEPAGAIDTIHQPETTS